MRKIFSVLIIFFLILNLTGCETVRKKFTRKKKPAPKVPRFYQVKKYVKRPSPELYHKHYAYWGSWQSELISVLGKNHKKDIRCIEEIVGQLIDMQNILVPEKGEELTPHINTLVKVKDIIDKENLSQANIDYIKSTLEREDRFIKREFCLSKVKKYIKKSFEGEEVE